MRAKIGLGSKKLERCYLYIIWSLLVIITLLPIYYLIITSFRSRAEFISERSFLQTSVYIENYRTTLIDQKFGRFAVNSLIIATGNSILSTGLGILAAYAFSRYKIRGSNNILFWTITNRMGPPAAFILPIFLIFTRVIKIGNWSLYDTYMGIIWVYCLFNLPLSIWLLKGIFDNIPKSIDEAAKIDGATTFGILRWIIVPSASHAIATSFLLNFIFAWNEFIFNATLTSVKARGIVANLSNFITASGTYWTQLAAMGVISMLPALIIIFIVQPYMVAGLTFGAVRE